MNLSLLFVSLFFPKILSLTFPFAVLFAALLVGSQLSSNSELVAFTATGVSPVRQLRPYWVFSILAAILYAAFLFQFVPLSKIARDTVFNRITRVSLTSAFQPGEFSKVGKDSYLMARGKSADGTLNDVVLFTRLGGKKEMYSIELAEHASFPSSSMNVDTDEEFHALSLVMKNGNAYIFGKDVRGISTLSYRLKTVSLNIEGFVSSPDSHSVRYINRLPWIEFKNRLVSGSEKAWILLLKRLLLLLFVFLAPTLAYSMSFNLARGEGKSGAFVASFGIAFCFFVIVKLFEGFSLKSPGVSLALFLVINCSFLWLAYKYYVRLIKLPQEPAEPKITYIKRLKRSFKQQINKLIQSVNMIDNFQMGTLNGYIRLQFLRIFISALFAMEGVYVLSITLVNLPKFLEINAPMHIMVGFIAASLPPTLPYVLPFSFVIAALFHFSWMDSKSEIVAIKSLGMSVYRASAPLFRLALVVSVFMIFVNTYLSPVFLGKARSRRPQAVATTNAPSTSKDVNQVIRSSKDPDLSYYYEGYGEIPEAMVSLEKLVAFKFSQDVHKLQWAYTADKLDFDNKGLAFPTGGKKFVFLPSGDIKSKPTAFFIPDSVSFFSLHRPEVDEMTSYQLRQYISEQKRIGVQPYRYITTYYDRFASAFSPLILLLVGLPFVFMGKGGRRKTPVRGIASGIVLVVLYYAFASLFHSFGAAHYLPPFLAAWMINILFLLGGVFLFTEVRT